MTFAAATFYRIRCNTSGCPSTSQASPNKWDAQQQVKANGWRTNAEDHLCPKCLKALGERP